MNEKKTGFGSIAITKAEGGKLLPIGNYDLEIVSVTPDEAHAKHGLWSDPTPQCKVSMKCDEGFHTEWFMLRGFTKFDELTKAEQKNYVAATDPDYPSDKPYAVDKKTNMRKPSDEHSASALNRLSAFVRDSGIIIEEDESLPLDEVAAQLIGRKISVKITANENGRTSIKNHRPVTGESADDSAPQTRSRRRAKPTA